MATASFKDTVLYVDADHVEGGFCYQVFDRNLGLKLKEDYGIPTWEEAYTKGLEAYKALGGL